MNALRAKYAQLAAKPGFQKLRATCPIPTPTVTMLGEAQWKWLGEQLRAPAEVRRRTSRLSDPA